MRTPTIVSSVDVDEAAALRYAEATLDDSVSYREGSVPPMFALVLVHSAVEQVGATWLTPRTPSPLVLHSDQELRLTRPLRLGERLSLAASLDEPVARGRWSEWVLRAELEDDDGTPIARSRAALLTPIVDSTSRSRSRPPGSSAGRHPRRQALAAVVHRRLSAALLDRYVEASGDRNPIHLSDSAAHALGLPGRVVHGLLTLAVGVNAAMQSLGGGGTPHLSFVRCRFSGNVPPDTNVQYRYYRTDADGLYDLVAIDETGSTVLKRAHIQL